MKLCIHAVTVSLSYEQASIGLCTRPLGCAADEPEAKAQARRVMSAEAVPDMARIGGWTEGKCANTGNTERDASVLAHGLCNA